MNGRIFFIAGVVINSAKTVWAKSGGGLKDKRAPWSKKCWGGRALRSNSSLRLCSPPVILLLFITVSYFLQFSFYSNMRLIQFTVYFNHHVHIFMLSYITRYSHFRNFVSANSWPPIRTYVSANNISLQNAHSNCGRRIVKKYLLKSRLILQLNY